MRLSYNEAKDTRLLDQYTLVFVIPSILMVIIYLTNQGGNYGFQRNS